jgi:hypothetical protein
MFTYNIKTIDALTGQPVIASLYFLDGPAGNGITLNGQPVAFQTDANGTYTLTNQTPPLYLRVQSTGYVSQNVTAQPGNNTITLSGVSVPDAVITATGAPAAASLTDKLKPFLLIAAILLLLYLVVKYKILR